MTMIYSGYISLPLPNSPAPKPHPAWTLWGFHLRLSGLCLPTPWWFSWMCVTSCATTLFAGLSPGPSALQFAFKFRRSLDACISFHLDIALLLWRYTCPCHIERTNCLSDFTRLGDDHKLVHIWRRRGQGSSTSFPSSPSSLSKMLSRTNCKANSRVGQDLKKVFCNSWQKISSHLR